MQKRLDGLVDEPRRLTDAQLEQVITETLERTPRDATHGSTRMLATGARTPSRDRGAHSSWLNLVERCIALLITLRS